MTDSKITSATVRDDFNSIEAVLHYTRAAVSLGLWESERILIERYFTDHTAPLLEAGCGAGRATLGLWSLGYRDITAFDFASELLEQAQSLARERDAHSIRFLLADATRLDQCHLIGDIPSGAAGKRLNECHLIGDIQSGPTSAESGGLSFGGALFLFNGLMQIPGRANRRAALAGLHSACRTGAPLIFTTHDRDACPEEAELWARERAAWQAGMHDPRLVEFGDRYMTSTEGRIFMHLPDVTEIREDLAATGWQFEFTAMRREIARESRAVREFSDECRFWVARRK
ncbi:MAG TPA: methyltransferase domain-containing protein [Opitutaceae bacterium]|nr:methyltransferase domain-containing protein [Opitutaceae bacterium]